jgi:hypothetical protein
VDEREQSDEIIGPRYGTAGKVTGLATE